jgi:hypothetical protein
MKKANKAKPDELRAEYDFRGAVRGQHHKALDKGYTAHVHKPNGTTVVEHYELVDGAVMLQSDVRAYFPDSEAVNKALRSLIALMSSMPNKRKKTREK